MGGRQRREHSMWSFCLAWRIHRLNSRLLLRFLYENYPFPFPGQNREWGYRFFNFSRNKCFLSSHYDKISVGELALRNRDEGFLVTSTTRVLSNVNSWHSDKTRWQRSPLTSVRDRNSKSQVHFVSIEALLMKSRHNQFQRVWWSTRQNFVLCLNILKP